MNREDYASRYIESCFELSMAVDSPLRTIPVDTCASSLLRSPHRRTASLIYPCKSWSHADLARELHAVDARIRAVDAATFADAVSRSNCRLRPLSLALNDSSWFAEDQIDPCCATAVALGVSTLALPITAEYFSRWVSALGITVL